MTPKRVAVAAVLSPWIVPALIIVAATMHARGWPFNFGLGRTASLGVLPAYGGLFLVGFPIFNWLRRTQRLSLLVLTGCGALGGVIFLLAFSAVLVFVLNSPLIRLTLRDLTLDVGWGVILGSAVAVTFGLIAGVPERLRHDQVNQKLRT